jgi:hypothetical protein
VFKYPFYHIISIYVSHSSIKLEKGTGSYSDSRFSHSRLLDSADHNGSSLNFFSLSFIMAPSFAAISSSQSNYTLSDDTLSNQTFTSLSHSFGENQSKEQPTPSDDEGDQEADD